MFIRVGLVITTISCDTYKDEKCVIELSDVLYGETIVPIGPNVSGIREICDTLYTFFKEELQLAKLEENIE